MDILYWPYGCFDLADGALAAGRVFILERIPEKCVAVFGQEYAHKQKDSATKRIQRLVTSASAAAGRALRPVILGHRAKDPA